MKQQFGDNFCILNLLPEVTYAAKFSGYKSCESGEIFSVCHVISRWSYD